MTLNDDWPLYIDAEKEGNIARFYNHSCQPNLSFTTTLSIKSKPIIVLHALKDIEIGEKLTISYVDKDSLGFICLCGHCD